MFCIANGSCSASFQEGIGSTKKPYKIIITPTFKPCRKDAKMKFGPCSKPLVAYQDQSHPTQTRLIRSTRIGPDFIGRDLAELIETKAIYKGLLVIFNHQDSQRLQNCLVFFLMNWFGGYVCLMHPFKGMGGFTLIMQLVLGK